MADKEDVGKHPWKASKSLSERTDDVTCELPPLMNDQITREKNKKKTKKAPIDLVGLVTTRACKDVSTRRSHILIGVDCYVLRYVR